MSDRLFIEAWSFSHSEFEFLQDYGNTTRAWVGVQLRHFREHAFFPEAAEGIPGDALSYVAEQIGVQIPIFAVYDFSSATARRHRLDILRHLGFRRATGRDRQGLQDWLEGELGGQDVSLEGWISRGYQWCLHHSVYVPSGKIMERLARSARHVFYERFIENVARHLTRDTVRQLEDSLVDPQAPLGFQRLKDDVGAATLENVLAASAKVGFFRSLKLPHELFADLDQRWVLRIARRVEGETASEMRRHKRMRGLGLFAIYLMLRQGQLIDARIQLASATSDIPSLNT